MLKANLVTCQSAALPGETAKLDANTFMLNPRWLTQICEVQLKTIQVTSVFQVLSNKAKNELIL